MSTLNRFINYKLLINQMKIINWIIYKQIAKFIN